MRIIGEWLKWFCLICRIMILKLRREIGSRSSSANVFIIRKLRKSRFVRFSRFVKSGFANCLIRRNWIQLGVVKEASVQLVKIKYVVCFFLRLFVNYSFVLVLIQCDVKFKFFLINIKGAKCLNNLLWSVSQSVKSVLLIIALLPDSPVNRRLAFVFKPNKCCF